MGRPLSAFVVLVAGVATAEIDATEAVRTYLRAVYPAAAASLAAASSERVEALFASLDYFYHCDAARLAAMSPPAACAPISKRFGAPKRAPPLPYLPPGAYFDAAAATTDERPSSVARGSFVRWRRLGFVSAGPQQPTRSLFSSVSSRIGPAPSWTNPAAVTRYAKYPLGLNASALGDFLRPRDPREGFFPGGSLRPSPKFAGLAEGDGVEVEQHGGADWVSSGLPAERGAVFGLFLNAWRGTGLFLNVGVPWVSRSKATAIVEMLREVEARGGGAIVAAVADGFGLGAETEALGGGADALAALLYTEKPPSSRVGGYRHVKGVFNLWRAAVRDGPTWLRPPRRVADFIAGPKSLALHWFAGIGSVGPYRRPCESGASCASSWASWDGLLMALACFLGVKTIVLDAAANDNGCFHEEIVDYDAPGGWAPIRDASLNGPRECLAPFSGGLGLPSPDALLAHWDAIGKFSLADPLNASAPARPCALLPVPRDPRLCRARGGAATFCYLACDGALSSAHATIAVDHAPPKRRRAPANWTFGDASLPPIP